MSEIDDLRKAMREAQVFGKGQYILLGLHLLEVQKQFYKRSLIDGVAKESIVTEFTVKESNNPEMVIGETRSNVYNFEKKGGLSRFKAMTFGLIGIDPDGKLSPQAHEAATDVLVALKFDQERVRLGLPENFMTGRLVISEGIKGSIKTGPHAGKECVDLKWRPYGGPVAPAAPAT